MKLESIPYEISRLVPFSTSISSQYIPKVQEILFSGISKNGLWMWIACGTTINIYHTENSEWFGGHCFAESLKNPSAKITSIVEFSSSHISFPCLLISINQDHESIICLYDVKTSKVNRAVQVPDTIFKMEVICGNGGACRDTHHLYLQLRYMFGILSLATSSGHLYFLDLCLDEGFFCDENSPSITSVMNKYELSPEHRARCISKQQHPLMQLNDQSGSDNLLDFESRSSVGNLPYERVWITALKYIKSTVTLVVGFNLGRVQLWSLQDLCFLYNVRNPNCEQAVVSFAFQEPENDPRNFCYLWVISGHSANEKPEDFSIATMYSLTYHRRTYIELFGNLYTDFQSCNRRFEYPLTSDPFSAAQSSTSIGSCIVSCQTVCQSESHCLYTSSANDSDTVSENMSLCFLSWLVWSDAGNSPTSYHLALFDLNQWYQAQMPVFNFRSPSDLVSYLAHFSLQEVFQNFISSPILGLFAIPHSIKKFKFLTPSEEYFYPSSLDFQTILYSATGICNLSFIGLQKNMLYEMADKSPHILINPKEFYLDLIKCGLVSDPHGNSERVPLIVQREALLQLALEYHIPVFFMKCLKEWKYSDSIQEGCTSRALLNWAWKKMSHIKNSIDKICLPFFNCSGLDIDKTSLKTLHSYRRQLDLIDTIFMGYQKFATPRTELGIEEVKCRREIAACLSMHLQVLLWLRLVHILPEVCEGEETEKNVFYSVNTLVNDYLKRRHTLQKIHSSVGATDILLIDGFVKESFSENSWQKMGGNGNYPPPSVYAALSIYFIDGVDLELKHSLMYYFLLDVCNAFHNLKSPLTVNVKNFPTVFWMSESNERLIKAFWFLDQFNFKDAIKELLHPMVNASDILPWQHQRIIKSFLFQREAQKALKYINHMNPPENTLEDMKLRLSVFICRGSITQAFDYQRKKQTEGFRSELLQHLLLGCQETQRLKDVMYLPLNDFESFTLIKFLSENKDPRAQEALVMYQLLHCNFFEAAKVNEKLSLSISIGGPSTRERTAGRDALVESLLSSVPKVEKNLVEEISRFPSLPLKKTELQKPMPLSTKIAPQKQVSYSDILNSLLSYATSVMHAPYMDSRTPVKLFRSESSFSNMPFLRPPLTPECTRISTEAMCSTPVTKRTLASPTSEFSSPTKKSRLLDNATFKSSPLLKKKIPKHLAGDVASLLQSPPIARRRSRKESLGSSPKIAPQGILKNKIEASKFPTSDIFTSKTPSVLSDAGESIDNEVIESEKMVIDDEVHEDLPGRQIRFNVPLKDDLSSSVISSISVESSAKEECLLSENPIESFIKKRSETIKPVSSLDSFESRFQETKRPVLTLTREPLKSHTSLTLERLPISEQSKILHETASQSNIAETMSKESSLYSEVKSKITSTPETFIDLSDSDSSSVAEILSEALPAHVFPEPVEPGSSASSIHLSRNILSSTPTNLEKKEQSPSPVLNKSGSSSGNSSYSSASERSLIVTPRRPLRDKKNVSISDASMISAVESIHDETLCQDAEKRDYVMEIEKTSNQLIEDSTPIQESTNENDNFISSESIPVSTADETKEESVEKNMLCYETIKDSDIICITAESIDQDIEVEADIPTENINQITSEPVEIDTPEVIISSETSKSMASTSTQNLIVNIDVPMFTKVTPSLPKYIPIKERIHQSEKNADCNTISTYPNVTISSQSEISKIDSVSSSRVSSFSVVTPRKSIHPASETVIASSSSDAMDTDKTVVENTPKSLYSCILSNKNTPKDLLERFDYMSKNSEQYENSKVYKKAMKMLADDFSYDDYKPNMETKPSRKTRTYIFEKTKSSTKTKDTVKTGASTSKIPDETSKKFLDSEPPESYEQFSLSIQKEVLDAGSKIETKSSPNTEIQATEKAEAKQKIRKKQDSSILTSVDKTPKSSIKKAKERSKVAKKMEFYFAEPISPADPEILEALSTPSEHPVGNFMFSPPLTRGRLRQKKMDESLGSSFASVTSEASFIKQKKPPVDPILEEIMAEKTTETKDLRETPSKAKLSSKKKVVPRKLKTTIPSFEISNISLDSSKLETSKDMSKSKDLSKLSLSKQDIKHKMVLRQAKAKAQLH